VIASLAVSSVVPKKEESPSKTETFNTSNIEDPISFYQINIDDLLKPKPPFYLIQKVPEKQPAISDINIDP
jgi:hypothetical protein